MKMKKVRSVLLAAALTCSMIVTPVMAAPDDTTSLQNQKESAQNEVNGLQAQLNELFTKTNDLETQLINKGQEITKAQEDLAVAEEKKQQQYEDMKLRIKYMYEEGDTSALERIVASGSISEMSSDLLLPELSLHIPATYHGHMYVLSPHIPSE